MLRVALMIPPFNLDNADISLDQKLLSLQLPVFAMFRCAILKRATVPLQDNAKGFWLVENKHLASAAFVVGASLYALRMDQKSGLHQFQMEFVKLRKDIKSDIRALTEEIRTSLTSRRASDTHA